MSGGAPGGGGGTGYADQYAYLADELERLDLLLRLRLGALRRVWQDRPGNGGPGLYITDGEVEWLLNERTRVADDEALVEALARKTEEVEARTWRSQEAGFYPALTQLARLFGLSRFETDALLVCLAPELRRGYDRIYAYLQDDITRMRPSVDLVLELLCDTESERWRARALLGPQAPLLHARLLDPVDDPQSPSGSSGLAQFLRLDPRILEFLLGQDTLDARLADLVQVQPPPGPGFELPVDGEVSSTLLGFLRRWAADDVGWRSRLVVHLHGPRGVGKRELALALCGVLERPMLTLDAERLPQRGEEVEVVLRLALRESLLLQAPLYISPADVFTADTEAATVALAALTDAVRSYGWMVILAGHGPWTRTELFEPAVFYSAALAAPGFALREATWARALDETWPDALQGELPALLAERFRLTPGQIREAARMLGHRHLVRGGEASFAEVAAVCRAQAHHKLGALASKIEPHYDWADLVLPDETMTQLWEMCSQAQHRHRVYEQWGFGRKLTRGRGISGLFTGPPGTGKTMAVEVIAHELDLDLYKVDLARVVSKYIGETEKNLSRIFDEAESSNAVLFFDEADALFGKRTEISDAHDRYANVETSYLLQRMEEYGGIVVLASNLRENMDDAFLRRIRFLVDFPFPDAASRLKIWRTHLPAEAPIGEDVDCAFLAEQLPIAGGNIRNIVVNAAFLAAADSGVIRTEHLLRGGRREFEKIGKLWDEARMARANGAGGRAATRTR